MNFSLKAGLASAALAVAACFAPVSAADLNGGYGYGGSIKDGYAAAPVASAAGPCYVRADVGYSWSQNAGASYVGNIDPTITSASMGNGGLFEAGIGCGMGSRGVRGEIVVGTRENKTWKGDYTDFSGNGAPVDPTLTTTIKTYTMMFNGYYDLGKVAGFVPYVGAGMGFAYHKMGDVKSSLDPSGGCGGCAQFGDEKLSFAWALMAGVGYQISDRAILDIGYRYIDMGLARSMNVDSLYGFNPRLEINDQSAHEFKIGLRYHFGTDCCTQTAYAPMK